MEAQTRTSGADTATLGPGSVLVGSLPVALMTDEAPDRYTVEAVFTRRPERDEIIEILGGETRDHLTRAGYSTVEVTVSDRRLEIANTNLEELRDGLGRILADRLAEISARVRRKHDVAAMRFQVAAVKEQERIAAVAALAGSVSFRVSAAHGAGSTDVSDQWSTSTEDLAQIDDWNDEGGQGL